LKKKGLKDLSSWAEGEGHYKPEALVQKKGLLKIVGPTPLMCTTANIKFIPDIKLYIPSTFTLEIKPG
jgi:hypothetical protein